MDDLAIARAVHVAAVVIWIGGVAMVTTILLPIARKFSGGATLFEAAERRFTVQARITTLLAGATGFYMVWRLSLWDRFYLVEFWWMHAMVAVWALFTGVLFAAEPLLLDRWYQQRVATDPGGTLAFLQRFHWLMLAIGIITILGAVAGSHGLLFFG